MLPKKVLNVLDKSVFCCTKVSCLLSFAFLFILLFSVVTIRYLKLSSIFWSDDAVNLLMVWVIFVGAVLCVRNNDHVSVTFFLDALRNRNVLRKVFTTFNELLVLFFLILLLRGLWKLMSTAGQSLLPRIPITKFWWYLPIFVSILVMIFYTVSRIFSILLRKES